MGIKKSAEIQGSNRPQKGEPASETAASAEFVAEGAGPVELAKSFSPSEAQQIVGMRLKPIKTETLLTKIYGDSLITNKWSEKALREMLQSQQQTKEEKKLAKNTRAKKDPEADFQGARYHWDDKNWFPSTGIKKSMVTAGFALGIPRSIIQRSVFVFGESLRDYVEIVAARVVKREDAVRVGPFNNRTADLRYRPELQNWVATLKIEFRSDVISAQQVVMLLQNAGYSIGIGEWRPEKDGQFGRFNVEEMADDKEARHAA